MVQVAQEVMMNDRKAKEDGGNGGRTAMDRPSRKGVWAIIGGLVAIGLAAGYRWWRELPK